MEQQTISRLGFGLMRLPLDKDGKIDYPQGEEMVDKALESGITYFDTAYMYHSGESERFIGKALCQRKPRESFMLADKMPMSMVETKEDVARVFEEQLERCCVQYFDYYLLHALNKSGFQKVKDLEVLEFVKEKQRQGKIKKLGFSFHDTYDVLEDILSYTKWDFVQLQLNYYDLEQDDFKAQYKAAIKSGLPIIVMEPVRGGFLARTVPEAQKVIESAYGVDKSAALALSFVNDLPGVDLVLSGMSDNNQLNDNIATFANPIKIDEKAQAVIEKVLEEIARFKTVDCTKCEYCLPCPLGIDIPKIFKIYNDYEMFKSEFSTKNAVKGLEVQPAECIACKKCESKCPQAIKISNLIKGFAQRIEKF